MNDAGQPGGGSEELARLLAALLEGLVRPPEAEDPADEHSSGSSDEHEHVGLSCRICPVCRAIAMLRQTRPEVLEHLVAAAGELSAAVRLTVASPGAAGAEDGAPGAGGAGPVPGAEPFARRGREPVPVERIEVTD